MEFSPGTANCDQPARTVTKRRRRMNRRQPFCSLRDTARRELAMDPPGRSRCSRVPARRTMRSSALLLQEHAGHMQAGAHGRRAKSGRHVRSESWPGPPIVGSRQCRGDRSAAEQAECEPLVESSHGSAGTGKLDSSVPGGNNLCAPSSWPARPSPAISCAGPPTSTTAWTPPRRGHSSAGTSPCPSQDRRLNVPGDAHARAVGQFAGWPHRGEEEPHRGCAQRQACPDMNGKAELTIAAAVNEMQDRA